MVELQRIKLKGFKSIREMDLALRDLNVLVGANGSGKSNFLSLFTLLNRMAAGRLREFVALSGGPDALLYLGRKTTESVSCRLELPPSTYYFAMRPAVRENMTVFDETWESTDPRYPVQRDFTEGGYSLEARLAEAARSEPGSIAEAIAGRLEGWRVYHFHDTSDSAKVKQTCDLDDNGWLRPDASNLASILYLLREKCREDYRTIVDVIQMVAPFFDDFHLRPTELNDLKIRLKWRQTGSDALLGPEALSDGTLRFMCLATLLLQPKRPSLIIIDEPELGLHPHAIGLMAAMLKSASVKSQVIVCTQSVTLVNQLKPADVVVLEREDGPTTFRRLSDEDMSGWLDEYGLGDLWEKNILGGSP